MIITLSGPNSLLLQQQLQKRVQDFIATHGDFGLERLNAGEVEYTKLLGAAQAMPFLAAKRMVIISDVASNKILNDKIADLLLAVNEQTDVILIESKFDKRSSLYKTLKKETVFNEFNELDEQGLAKWLVAEARANGGMLSPTDARYLVQRLGLNQLLLSNELSKLVAYRPEVTKQTIEMLTDLSPQSTIFELIGAIFSGNKQRALKVYEEQRKLKVEPQAILGMLAWQLHVLVLVESAGSRPAEQIARDAKLSPFVVRKSAQLAHQIPVTKLKRLVRSALDLDIRLKKESVDADQAIRNLIVSI